MLCRSKRNSRHYSCCCLVIKSCPIHRPVSLACQAPLDYRSFQQDCWKGLPFSFSRNFLPRIKHIFPAWQTGSLPLSHLGSPDIIGNKSNITIIGKNRNARIVRDMIACLQLFSHLFNHLFFLFFFFEPEGWFHWFHKDLYVLSGRLYGRLEWWGVTLVHFHDIHSDWRHPGKKTI